MVIYLTIEVIRKAVENQRSKRSKYFYIYMISTEKQATKQEKRDKTMQCFKK